MRHSDVPMYVRIERDLRQAIGNGELPLGSRVPSEEALCRKYDVSRMTARQALTRLADAGLLVRRQGVGTFVTQTKVARVVGRLLGFHEDAQALGLDPSTNVLSRREEPAGADDAALLGCTPDTLVMRVERSRFLGGQVIGLNQVTVAPVFVSPLTDADFAGSFYQEVERLLGIEIRDAEAKVEAVTADTDRAALLDVSVGAPLLRTTRVTYLTDGRLLGLTRTVYRGDRYYLSLTIRKDSPG